MLSRECFHETIEQHPILIENPYTREFAFGHAPTHAEVQDFLVQCLIFQKKCVSLLWSDVAHFSSLRELAVLLPVDHAHDLNGWLLGDSARATRETRHCLHQLERSYGSKNESTREGARAALRRRTSHGAKENPAVKNSFWQIAEGIKRHNRAYREGKELPPLPLDFFERNLLVVAEYGDCFLETKRRSDSLPDFSAAEWRLGAKMALDAIYLFWKGLERRKKLLQGK